MALYSRSCRGVLDLVAHPVDPAHLAVQVVGGEAQRRPAALRQEALPLGLGQVAVGMPQLPVRTVVLKVQPLGLLLLQVVETPVGPSAVQEALGLGAVERQGLALPVGRMRPAAQTLAFVRRQPQPGQAVEDVAHGALVGAVRVAVLDAEDVGAAALAGVEIVEQRGAGVADVQVARGRRRETDSYGHGTGELLGVKISA
jgi:hypothetical protein